MIGGSLSCAVAAGLAALGILLLLRRRRRARAPDPARLAEALRADGWEARAAGRWVRAIDGIGLVLDDDDRGFTWSARLTRYSAVSLKVEERGDEWPPVQRENGFLAGDPELDERFRFTSERPAQALGLIASEGVGEALLALPWVHLEVRGDEVALRDPERRCLEARLGRPAPGPERTTPDAVRAQLVLHRDVGALVRALARHR